MVQIYIAHPQRTPYTLKNIKQFICLFIYLLKEAVNKTIAYIYEAWENKWGSGSGTKVF